MRTYKMRLAEAVTMFEIDAKNHEEARGVFIEWLKEFIDTSMIDIESFKEYEEPTETRKGDSK